MISHRSKAIKILATLGPSSLDSKTLAEMETAGVDLFRINLSHTSLSELDGLIAFIQKNSSVPVCIDSEGTQLRTGKIPGGERIFNEGEMICLGEDPLPFNFNEALKKVEIGDQIHVDFDSVVIEVVKKKKEGGLWGRVGTGGKVGSNRAAHIWGREISLPALTSKDREAVRIARRHGLSHFALSFAGSVADVQRMRKLIGEESRLISKIESNGGLQNLSDICLNSDALLIDRGDLSRAQPLEKIPFLQKKIIAVAKALNKEVYVATNLLETMTLKKEPTRAEVCDVAGALFEGADGLVLAAETAIGRYPVPCVTMIRRIINEWQRYKMEN